MVRMHQWVGVASMALALAAFAGEARAQESQAKDPPATEDPLEPINRVTSEVNRGLRTMFINPLATFYKAFTPEPVQGVVSNAASNLTEPLTAVSSMLQGDQENAEIAMERFFVNTTEGLGGTRDVATEKGIIGTQEDIGQVFGAHGAGGGAHIVLPILGPSNMRDASGDVINFLVNPLSLANTVDKATTYADNMDEIEGLSRNAVDPYVAEREAYERNRQYEIRNGKVEQDFPTLDEGGAN